MIAIKNQSTIEEVVVVHPLFDSPEEKRDGSGLGVMPMSRSVRLSLMLLRGYLMLMTALLAFHLADQAGLFGRHR